MIESPIIYTGSKFKLLPKLIKKFPTKKDGIFTFVDLFTGGGSVYMNIAEYYDNVYANDILKDLIDIHINLKNSEYFKTSVELSKLTKTNQDAYNKLREEYNLTKDSKKLLALIWSCNNNMLRYNNSGNFNQTWGKRSVSDNTIKNHNIFITKDYSNVTFSNLQFDKVTQFDKTMFIYIDPPYSNTGAGYNITWSEQDDLRLIKFIEDLIFKNIYFGLSGCLNNLHNLVYDNLKKYNLNISYFGDLYKNINKTNKNNKEYYITNFNYPNEVTVDDFM